MKKNTVSFCILCIGIILILFMPTTTCWMTSDAIPMFNTVRNKHLKDIHDQSPILTPPGLYHTYEEMTVFLHTLAMNHSGIMSLTSIGKTYEGRDLWVVKLSDNVTVEEDEPGVLFMGAHHGNEKPSYEVCLFFIRYMVEKYENGSAPEVRQAMDNTQIYIIPMVNPDGVEAGTRKNRVPNHGSFGFKKEITSYGVDLNRNYAYRWLYFFLRLPRFMGSTSFFDESNTYRGKRPFSERETQAIRHFIDTHPITVSISYHTYGNLILYPWAYTSLPSKDKPIFVSISQNISKINNYTVSQSIDLYPTIGDACDWMYGTYGIFAFTIELGESYALLDPEMIQEMGVLHTDVNLYICQRVQLLDR